MKKKINQLTYQKIKESWNKQADQFNGWDNLDIEEKVEFAYRLGCKNEKDKEITNAK
jgi:hypothetical protein